MGFWGFIFRYVVTKKQTIVAWNFVALLPN